MRTCASGLRRTRRCFTPDLLLGPRRGLSQRCANVWRRGAYPGEGELTVVVAERGDADNSEAEERTLVRGVRAVEEDVSWYVLSRPGSSRGADKRRADETSSKPRKFLVDVEETMKLVLEQEDTTGNFQVSRHMMLRRPEAGANVLEQIAATDTGPKVLSLGTAASNGHNSFDVRPPLL